MADTTKLKRKTISGVFWQLLQKGSSQAVAFVVSVVLARLIPPEEFGIVAMASIFMTIAGVLAESGLGTSLVQKKNIDEIDKNTVFYFGLFLSICLYALLFFSAPLIANMYHNDYLTHIIRVAGLSLFFSSFGSVQSALVMRDMDFKKYFYATLTSTIVSAVAGLFLAFNGYGVWALVLQGLIRTVTGIAVLFFLVRWVPQMKFSWGRLKKLYSFGLNLTAASLIGTVCNELRGFLIGLRFMPADLAFYNRGNGLPGLVNDNVSGTISTVLFPAISQLQDDRDAVKRSMRRAIMTSSFFLAPLMMVLAATSKQVILLMYTETWASAIPFMQVLSLGYIFSNIGMANLQAINAIGRSDITFKLEFIKKPIYLALIFAGVMINPLAIAVGYSTYTIIGSAINAVPNKMLIGYSYIEQFADLLPQLVLSAFVAAVAWLIGRIEGNILLILAAQWGTSTILYLGIAKVLHFESFKYVCNAFCEYTTR